jgi:hypothetical protein
MFRTASRISRRAVTAGLLGCALASAASAQNAPASGPITVLELFTSQGCSSCPAADVLFKTYAARPDVIALSYSVDYWDYLGWKDSLASPAHSARQRAYGRAISNGQVYTPQVVVNGTNHVVGSSRGDIEAAIAASRSAAAAQAFGVSATFADGAISIAAAPSTPGLAPANGILWLARVATNQSVAVKRGENSGRTLTYNNVVRTLTEVGSWSGAKATVPVTALLGADERYAVLIQRGPNGPMLGGGWVR